MDRVKDAPSERNHALVAAKVFFGWSLEPATVRPQQSMRGHGPHQAAVTQTGIDPERTRGCVRTAIEGHDDFSRIVALLVLTGQRRGEIAALEWDWINTNNCTITLPATIAKNETNTHFRTARTSPRYWKARRPRDATSSLPVGRPGELARQPASTMDGVKIKMRSTLRAVSLIGRFTTCGGPSPPTSPV